jgi:hypothetical protein
VHRDGEKIVNRDVSFRGSGAQVVREFKAPLSA